MVSSICLSKCLHTTATFLIQHVTLELIRLLRAQTSGNINLFYLHRPPPSINNQMTHSCFFSYFSFCWVYMPFYLCNIILEDLNVHIDVLTNCLVLIQQSTECV